MTTTSEFPPPSPTDAEFRAALGVIEEAEAAKTNGPANVDVVSTLLRSLLNALIGEPRSQRVLFITELASKYLNDPSVNIHEDTLADLTSHAPVNTPALTPISLPTNPRS